MNSVSMLIIVVVIGAAAGAAVVFAALGSKLKAEYGRGKSEAMTENATLCERLNSLNRELERAGAEIQTKSNEAVALQEKLTEEIGRRSAAEQLNARIPELDSVVKEKDGRISELFENTAALRSKITELDTTVVEERKAADEKLSILVEAREKLSDAFKALSSEALKSNNQSFIDLAKSVFEKLQEGAKGDLDQRRIAVEELIKPVRESLEKVDCKINELEKARVGAYESITQQVKSLLDVQYQLRAETGNLVKALRSPIVRGNWGEMQLKRVVEMAGMLDRCDFQEQQTASDDEGAMFRPDMIIKLPAGKNIVVDAKTPLSAFMDAYETSDDIQREAKLKEHARLVRSHIQDLGRKKYWDQFQPAPEFVILFLPGENFFSAALEHDPALIETGVDQKVLIATPTTLIGLLKAIAYGWRQESLARNAKEISDLGRMLYDRIRVMGEHWGRVGKNLDNAVKSYNDAVGSLETRVLVSARKFKELETTGDAEIGFLCPVEQTARALQASDIEAQPEEDEIAPDMA